MDGTGDHFVNCHKPVSQRQILHVFSNFCKLGGSRRGTIMDTNGEKEMRGKKE
jgi:hypothetical protein